MGTIVENGVLGNILLNILRALLALQQLIYEVLFVHKKPYLCQECKFFFDCIVSSLAD
jgi:hypothetical protein